MNINPRMTGWLSFPSVQVGLGLALHLLLGFQLGPLAYVLTLPLFAALVTRPLFALIANLRHHVREQTWLPVHGQHYVYLGTTLHVLEDDNRCRWVNLLDVQKITGLTASERALTRTYPGCLKRMGAPISPHIRDDALVAHLSKENKPAALRFRTWVERNIALPGRVIRQRLGIHPTTEDD